MDSARRSQRVLLAGVLALGVVACSGISSVVAPPTEEPFPTIGLEAAASPGAEAAAKSPMAGDWLVAAEFGRLVFTIDPAGKAVTKANFVLSGWKCGGTIPSTTLTVSSPDWTIKNGNFAIDFYLGDHQEEPMDIRGSYDEAKKTFSGTWQEDAYGTTCSGKWEATGDR